MKNIRKKISTFKLIFVKKNLNMKFLEKKSNENFYIKN